MLLWRYFFLCLWGFFGSGGIDVDKVIGAGAEADLDGVLKLHRSYLLLKNEIDNKAGEQGEDDDKRPVEQEPAHAEHNFQGAEIGDFGGGSGEHEGGCTADAHALPEPLPQKRDGAAAAGIEGNTDGGRHEHAPGLVAAEEAGHQVLRHITLEDGRQSDACEKIGAGGLHIPPDVEQIADEKIGMGVVAGPLFKAGEVEKRLVTVEEAKQQPGRNAAEKAADDANRQNRRAEGGTVDDELGV